MLDPKIIVLTGNLSGQISGGMGIATTEIALNLSAITPIQLIQSGTDVFPTIKNTHTINRSSPVNKISTPSIFKSETTEIANYDFLISPYRTENATKITHSTNTTDSIIETSEPATTSYLEEVAFYNQKVVTLAETLPFDVLYCHDWTTFQAGISLKLRTGKKLVLHIHSLETDRNPDNKNNIIYYLERKAMDYADAVITVSNYTKKLICKNYEIYPGKIHVVYNATANVEDKKQKEATTNRALNVLFMGRLTRQKGIDAFISIAEIVHKKFPTVQFIIAGEGELYSTINTRIENSEAVDQIHLLGYLNTEDKNKLLAITDIFCLPSESEPFGLSALEAAAVGIPCVLSKQAGISEILRSALKTNFDDIEGFALAIISLLESESLRKMIAEEQLVDCKELSWEKTAAQIKSIIQSVK